MDILVPGSTVQEKGYQEVIWFMKCVVVFDPISRHTTSENYGMILQTALEEGSYYQTDHRMIKGLGLLAQPTMEGSKEKVVEG